MYQSGKNVTINCHIPGRNVTIHISNKTRIWEHYVENVQILKFFRKYRNYTDFNKNLNFPTRPSVSENISIFNFQKVVKSSAPESMNIFSRNPESFHNKMENEIFIFFL